MIKRKVFKLLILALLCLLLVGCARSEYKYTSTDDGVTISEYTGSDTNLVVPEEYESIAVTIIDYNTYAYNIYIQNVILSKNIKIIKGCSFWYCTELSSVYVPKGLEIIEEYAFYNCPKLVNIYFEDSEANINIDVRNHNDAFNDAKKHYDVSLSDYKNYLK